MNTRMRGTQAGQARRTDHEPQMLTEQAFRQADVPVVRRLAHVFATRAGLASARVGDFVLAVSEAAASATAWGPCTARVRLWRTGSRAFCEVRGDGLMLRRSTPAAALAGRQDEEESLRRLVLHQVCDFFSVSAGDNGVRVLLAIPVS
jgi:predicted transcriptional regulator